MPSSQETDLAYSTASWSRMQQEIVIQTNTTQSCTTSNICSRSEHETWWGGWAGRLLCQSWASEADAPEPAGSCPWRQGRQVLNSTENVSVTDTEIYELPQNILQVGPQCIQHLYSHCCLEVCETGMPQSFWVYQILHKDAPEWSICIMFAEKV